MKQKKSNLLKDFFRIGLMAGGGGPIILALIYLILQACGTVETLTVSQVVLAIFTSFLLAFVAGGISVVYRIEKLPLMWASLIHVSVLYLDYLVIYLVNGWLPAAWILPFTGLFLLGYFAIWSCIYFSIRRNIRRMNQKLKNG